MKDMVIVYLQVLFGPKKNRNFSVVMLRGKKRRAEVVWFPKGVVLLRLKSDRGGKEREAAFLQ